MTQRATAIFHTFGCKLNFARNSHRKRYFATHGITDCPEGGVPDFIVVNSCSVTAEADRKCRSAIRNFHGAIHRQP